MTLLRINPTMGLYKDNFGADLSHARLYGWGFKTIVYPVIFISGMLGQFLVTTPEELDALGFKAICKPVVVFLNAIDEPQRENKDLSRKLCFTWQESTECSSDIRASH